MGIKTLATDSNKSENNEMPKKRFRSDMLFNRNRGFTLVELLVVISILGILAAALTTQINKAGTMAKAAKCKANLRNLAQASNNCGVETTKMPRAGSAEVYAVKLKPGDNVYRPFFCEEKGWLSWTGRSSDDLSASSPGTAAKYYGDKTKTYYSVTNGVLWAGGYIGRDFDTYLCGVHKKAAGRKSLDFVTWSYVMNGYFKYDDRTQRNGTSQWDGRRMDSLSKSGNAASLLLFAEIPAYRLSRGRFVESISTSVADTDGVLETHFKDYPGGKRTVNTFRGDEILGFNHQIGNRYVAHVAYADGHVDVVAAPTSPTEQKLKDLTFFLCNGLDVPAQPREWVAKRVEYWSAN